ncbi:MAG TPA: hypothetical protein VFA29_06915 [Candidatus Baltobacteraceae bacterium]|nr:hypothetical protein [Candidatus Baltobacteraceae bacterium]
MNALLAAVTWSLAIPAAAAAPRIDASLSDPAWTSAAIVRLQYNLRSHGPAPEETVARVMADKAYIYVAFDVKQSEPIAASQFTNDVGCCVDDSVQIDLWPNGPKGFRYLFISTPIGTRYQYSSENNVYEPTWWSTGRITSGGYIVTMKIPLAAMHGTGSGNWAVQFARVVQRTNDDIVWSYGAQQQNHNDVTYAAGARGLPALAARRAQPRAGVYVLSSLQQQPSAGAATRAGADLSIPVFAGTSLVAALRPDSSDVEVDQQTIAPSAFARQVNEVRPFFTQGASFYNTTGYCFQCPATELYTPSIPTPRDGYAVEGQRGLFSYAGFDAAGIRRSDTAQVLNYTDPAQQNRVSVQRGTSDTQDVHDDTVSAGYTHDDLHHLAEWIRYGSDSGTNVAAGDRAQRYETGVNLYSPTGQVALTLRKIGQYYNPVDGFVAHPDIAGYALSASNDFRFAPSSPIKDVRITAQFDRYQGFSGGSSQSDQWIYAQLATRKLWSIGLATGSAYLRLGSGVLSPANTGEGVVVYYGYGTATQSSAEFTTGRFGPGLLDAWTRVANVRAGRRATLTFELDDTQQFTARSTYTQWLERAAFNLQSGPDESLGIGVRRIIGTPPTLDAAAPFQIASNISIAYHRKAGNSEWYAVYGDAAAFSTVPAVIIKLIRYVGAEKGT